MRKSVLIGFFGGGYEAETLAQKARIEADGGTVVNLVWMNTVISTLKSMGIYSNCKVLLDYNIGVKTVSTKVSKLYDISGNNNDFTQGTDDLRPVWSLSNGIGIGTCSGIQWLRSASNIGAFTNWTLYTRINPSMPITGAAPYYGIMTQMQGTTTTLMPTVMNTTLAFYNGTVYSYDFSNNVGIHSIAYIYDTNQVKGFVDNNIGTYAGLTNPFSSAMLRNLYKREESGTSIHPYKGIAYRTLIFNIALSDAQLISLTNSGI